MISIYLLNDKQIQLMINKQKIVKVLVNTTDVHLLRPGMKTKTELFI